jgi:hypothetical protein
MSSFLLVIALLSGGAGSAVPSAPAPGDRSESTDDRRDVERRIAELASPRAADRARAERELAAMLDERDLETVRGAVKSGDAELRRRIALAIAASDRALEIAVGLALDADRSVADVGRDAQHEMLARWSSGYDEPAIPRAELRTKLRDKSERVIALDPDPRSARLDTALDELARFAAGSPPVVLEPDLATASGHAFHPSADFTGTFERVIEGLARACNVSVIGFAFDDDLGESARPWILVASRADDGERTASRRIGDWCACVGSSGADGAKRSACARAIAAVDWPAGLSWLERRWRASGDPSALDGVLLAAGRGRVVAALVDGRVQDELYRQADEALAERTAAGDERAESIARALSAAGPSGPGGDDLAARALAKKNASARETWLRLVVLEGTRTRSKLVVPFVDALLAGATPPPSSGDPPGASQALRFQALRTRATCAPGAPATAALADPRALFEWASAAHASSELVRALNSASFAPPRDWLDPARLPSAWRVEERLDARFAVMTWVAAADPERAAAHLAEIASAPDLPAEARVSPGEARVSPGEALLSPGEALLSVADNVRRWSREGGREVVERVLAATRKLGTVDAARLDRLEVLSGHARAETQARVLAACTSGSRSDLACLGAMASGPHGEAARAALLRAFAQAGSPADLVAALDRAVAELRAVRAEKDERAFVTAVRDAARDADPKLRASLRPDQWPAAPKLDVLRASELERRVSASGL